MTFIRDSDATRAELEQIRASVSCAIVLEREGFRIDRRESSRRCQKYRSDDGRIFIVNHEGRGWWDPDDSVAKGDVFKLVQYLQPGLTLAQAWQKLRPMIGLAPREVCAGRRTRSALPPVADRWGRLPAVQQDSPAWRYLTGVRALPDEIVQAAIRQDWLC